MTDFNSNKRGIAHLSNRNSNADVENKATRSLPESCDILIITERDHACIGYRLMNAINKHTLYSCRCIANQKHRRQTLYKFDYDIIAKNMNRKSIYNLLSKCKFILYSSSFHKCKPGGISPPRNIPKGLWHGGSAYRLNHKKYNKSIHPKFDVIFTHSDLEPLDENNTLLLAPYDTDKFEPIEKDFNGQLIIGHVPSNSDIKNTKLFRQASKILKDKYGDAIEISMPGRMSNKEIVNEKRKYHIYFDQILNQPIPDKGKYGYGISALEAGTFEQAILVAHNEDNDCPFINVRTSGDIVNEISHLVENRDTLEQISGDTRKWIIDNHSYKVVSNKFIKDIEKYLN